MQADVVELRDFYAGPLGGLVRRVLARRIRERWPRLPGATVVGLGYATPYLGSFREEAARVGALMPATQGAIVWPSTGPVRTAVYEENMLPLPDASVDHLLAVHCLEGSEHARKLLREIWRVLQPEGRLLIIAPNRRSVWARIESTPFGHGQPFSRSQLERYLRDTLFTPLAWSTALHMPPVERPMFLRSGMALERLGGRWWPGFGGVVIVEARKELAAPIGGATAARPVAELVPQGLSFDLADPHRADQDDVRLVRRKTAFSPSRL